MAIPDESLTRTEQYLNRIATGGGTIPEKAYTRIEMYLNKIATGSGEVPEEAWTRVEQYLAAIAENGGGSSVTVEPLTVTSNGTQTAPSGKAYSPVTVNVPNSYTDSDIGKAVSSVRTLQYQSSAAFTGNGEYNTTYNNRITVNVQPRSVYGNGGNTMLSNPFSELDFNSLYDAIQWHRLSGYLYYTFNEMTVQVELYARNNIIGGMAFVTDPAVVGVECEWNANGVVKLNALMSGQVQDMRAYASQIQCYVGLYGTDAPTPAD